MEQTANNVVLERPKHRPSYWGYGLADLDDETKNWLLSACLQV